MSKKSKTVEPTKQLPASPEDLARWAALRTFHDKVRETMWVHGISDRGRAAGIAIVEGKLTHIVISSPDDTTWTDEVTLAEAAKYIRESIATERDLQLTVELDDDGFAEFLRMVEAAGSKN